MGRKSCKRTIAGHQPLEGWSSAQAGRLDEAIQAASQKEDEPVLAPGRWSAGLIRAEMAPYFECYLVVQQDSLTALGQADIQPVPKAPADTLA